MTLALSLPWGAEVLAAPAAATSPAAEVPAPAAGSPSIEALPLEVSGKLSKDSRRTLTQRFHGAAAAAEVSGGPYRARLAVRLSNKRDYALTLTLLEAGDATAAEVTEVCSACSLDEAAASIEALVQKAAAGVVVKEVPPAPASVSVSSTPLGARVRVDGAEHGVTPQVLELPAGEHTVLVDKPGFLEHEQKITVEPGVAQELAIALTAQPPAPGSAKPGAGRGLKIGGAVVLGLGLAGVATGVAMILIDEDPMGLRCSGADVDFRGVCRYRYDTLLGGIVGTAVGGLGVAGGLAMLIKGHQISVRARAGKQQASLGLVVRW